MKKSFLFLKIPLESREKAIIFTDLEKKIQKGTKTHICTINPEILLATRKQKAYFSLLQATWNVVDGFGLQLWAKILYNTGLTRIPGVFLAEKVLALAAKHQKKVALVGGRGVAGLGAQKMTQKYPKLEIIHTEDGNPQQISEKLQGSGVQVLLVAFGAPAQDFFIKKAFEMLPDLRLAVGVGGTFDFWSGKVARAPLFLQKIGLEWLFRFVLQPKIRFRRIFRAVFVFSGVVLADFRKKSRKKEKSE